MNTMTPKKTSAHLFKKIEKMKKIEKKALLKMKIVSKNKKMQ